MKRVKHWSLTAAGSLVLREGVDPSEVSSKAWKVFNKRFRQWHQRGAAYPLDSLDAYQRGCEAMVKAASRVKCGEMSEAVRDAYVIAAGLNQLQNYYCRQVLPKREAYRELEEREAREGHEAGELAGPDPLASVNARHAAQRCLLATFPKLDVEAVRGFHCYLAAGGVMARAAKLAGMSESAYYRHFRRWCAQFREQCEWRG